MGLEDCPIEFWNRVDETSLINAVPDPIQTAMMNAAQERPDYFKLDEYDLFKLLKSEKKPPTPKDRAVRKRFWHEYDLAIKDSRQKVTVRRLCSGLYRDESFFYGEFLSKPEKVAWMLCRPTEEKLQYEEMLDSTVWQLREFVEHPFEDEKTKKVNLKVVELKYKIAMWLHLILNGAPTQRIEQTSKNLNVNLNKSDSSQPETLEEIEKALLELKKKDKQAIEVKAEVKDVSNISTF